MGQVKAFLQMGERGNQPAVAPHKLRVVLTAKPPPHGQTQHVATNSPAYALGGRH